MSRQRQRLIQLIIILTKSGCVLVQEVNKLFALDIGTRSCIGIILEEHNGNFHVVDSLLKEHNERAMLDGQIHDVLAVSKIIREIKEELEQTHGPLKKVSVAAAGRALKTERATVSIDITSSPLITKQDILHLELTAVQQAQSVIAEKYNQAHSQYYYCVGYSVLYYRLDDEEIGSLIDQQGQVASVEIIATFLPKVVVESLISALIRADLVMEALTLEPIAAINVLIPPSMRRLNVALVDIGAGTSDIAITDLSTVIAYGMVPIAGDEITEAISDQYLMDFPLAENLKRSINTSETIKITDILGFEDEVPKEEVIEKILPSVNKLATAIVDEILALNRQQSPKAVMLVGGGSQTPELCKLIAEKLNLPTNRVAIRGIDAIHSLTISDSIETGPHLVTPIGIAIAAHQTPVQYKTVYINEQPVRLFEVKKLTVGESILAAGLKMNKLYGKPGLAKIIELNGQSITIAGTHGQAPTILKNGVPCLLDEEVENNDRITIETGIDGVSTTTYVKDLVENYTEKQILINDESYILTPKLLINGKPATLETKVEDKDQIIYKISETIHDCLKELHSTTVLEDLRPFRLSLNEKEIFIPEIHGNLLKNGLPARLTYPIEHLDRLTIHKKSPITMMQLAEYQNIMLFQTLPITFNGNPIELKRALAIFKRGGLVLTPQDLVNDGDKIEVEIKKFEPFYFKDIFTQINYTIPKNISGAITILINQKPATLESRINPGDQLEIRL